MPLNAAEAVNQPSTLPKTGNNVQGNRQAVLKQVGNAVPMLMGRAVLDQVFAAATGLPPSPVGCLKGYGAGDKSVTSSLVCTDLLNHTYLESKQE